MSVKYYEVLVASQRYRKAEPLTYSSSEELHSGSVVSVELQHSLVLGIVKTQVGKPRFATKPIHRQITDYSIPRELLQLFDWLHVYYPAPWGIIAQLLLPSSLLTNKRQSTASARSEIVAPLPPALPPLTSEQSSAVTLISQAAPRSVLLHGDTGTGKTRIYLELARQAYRNGKSSLILTPEIGLTPQLVRDFEAQFPGDVITMHSNLTPAQRRDSWIEIIGSPGARIIIGPRSALFSPVRNLGLIVVDEMHDNAYKQEQSPHYQATRIAGRLAELHNAQLILGSATPSISDYYAFLQKKLPIIRLQKPAITHLEPPAIAVINLKDKKHLGPSRHLSNPLINAIADALKNHKQSLVFLNRRGTARLVMCQDCGWRSLCPKCDLPLTYHSDNHRLYCHTCGHIEFAPACCSDCQSANILFKSIGTKALVDELQTLFPKARIQRFDSDNLKSDRIENNYQAIVQGEVDILVGTQTLSKGLDLPELSVVGVVLADTGLYFPDYTAEERTFQMLSQVMGRVGRGHGKSTIVVQTYSPASPSIVAAVQKDYSAFYEREIQERQNFLFPPFCHLLKLSCVRKSSEAARRAATALANALSKKQLAIDIIGPSPAFTEKVSDNYRWQLVIKAKKRAELLKVIHNLPANWEHDLDPSNLL